MLQVICAALGTAPGCRPCSGAALTSVSHWIQPWPRLSSSEATCAGGGSRAPVLGEQPWGSGGCGAGGAWCPVRGALCVVPCPQCPVRSALSAVPCPRCPVCGALCTVSCPRCLVRGALCTVPCAWCPVCGALCVGPVRGASCTVPCVRCPVCGSCAQCPEHGSCARGPVCRAGAFLAGQHRLCLNPPCCCLAPCGECLPQATSKAHVSPVRSLRRGSFPRCATSRSTRRVERFGFISVLQSWTLGADTASAALGLVQLRFTVTRCRCG